MENIEVNAINSKISSEQKSQAPEPADDELLNDEELEAVCGGFLDFITDPVVNVLKGAYKAGDELGKALSGRLGNDDRYC